MPRIIENVRERLLRETASQLNDRGYAAVTVRSVANACDISVGTVYNYFPAKDDMIAACMLADWEPRIRAIQDASSASAESVLETMYGELSDYAKTHAFLFGDPDALPGYAGIARRYHGVLRGQLAEPLLRFCTDTYTAEFIAEAMLTWTLAGKRFEEIYSLIGRLL